MSIRPNGWYEFWTHLSEKSANFMMTQEIAPRVGMLIPITQYSEYSSTSTTWRMTGIYVSISCYVPGTSTAMIMYMSYSMPWNSNAPLVEFAIRLYYLRSVPLVHANFFKGSHPVSFRSFSCRLWYIVHNDDGLRVLRSFSVRGIIILSTKSYYAYVFAREV